MKLNKAKNIKTPFFFYGTLISPEVRVKVLGKDISKIEAASLNGYSVERVEGAHYPALIESDVYSNVNGIIAWGLGEKEVKKLDAFEGKEYFRGCVNAMTSNKKNIKCFAYLPKSGIRTFGKWDFSQWAQEEISLFMQKDFYLTGIRTNSSFSKKNS